MIHIGQILRKESEKEILNKNNIVYKLPSVGQCLFQEQSLFVVTTQSSKCSSESLLTLTVATLTQTEEEDDF
jgi:hypothetical protein